MGCHGGYQEHFELMAPGPRRGAEPGVASPGSLIITFAGLHLRNLGGWIAVADLITLMEAAGQASAAVRQALVRLKSRGYLAAERRTGRAGYRLTETAIKDLEVGDGRIFRFGEANESDGWVLAIFSVPEHARAERHRLRSQLIRMGFGTVSAGVWIAPAALSDRSRAQMFAQGLDGYVTWFVGRLGAPVQPEQWWDLDSLRALYQAFLDHWTAYDGAETADAGHAVAFGNDLLLVDGWRQFPRIDPGLPRALLPVDWQARVAFEMFTRLRGRWAPAAREFVARSVTFSQPTGV